MHGFPSLTVPDTLALPLAGNGVLAEQLCGAVLDGDDERVRRLLREVLGIGGQRLLERQRAQLAAFETLFGSMRRVALNDELTGVYNRRGFLRMGTRMLDALGRNLRSALVVYADVDDVKRINDTGGHSAGDRLLCDAAAALERAAGEGAVLGRLGGDEFAVLVRLGNDDRDSILERIRREVAACNANGRYPPLSLSLGSTPFDPLRPALLPTLLEKADRAMYVEKMTKLHRGLQAQLRSL